MIFDHLVLVDKELAAASRHFDRLGFTVRPGGEHPGWGTHNALIGLADGSYLELLAATQPWRAAFHRLLGRAGALWSATSGRSPFHSRFIRHLASGEGPADFAMLSSDLEAEVQAARSRGLELEGPLEGGRLRKDGQQVAWRTTVPRAPDLPFLIEDLTPRELRVPSGTDCRHANGVSGAAALVVASQDLERSVDQYRRLLGISPQELDPHRLQIPKGVCFTLVGLELILIPADKKTAMRRRATAPQTLFLHTSPGSPTLALRFSPPRGYELRPG